MKAIVRNLILLLVSTWYSQAIAQKATDAFWVIEGNPGKQDFTIVRFYSGDRKLIAEERIAQNWIDISRKRNVKMLNRKLQQKLAADSLARNVALKGRRRA